MKLRSRFAAPAAILVSALVAAASADAAFQKTGDASVRFTASGPGGMVIEGKGSSLWTIDDGKTVRVVVQLTAITTGMALRDKHMKEKYLETGKWPDAELVVNRADLKLPSAGAGAPTSASGTLKLHGVNRGTKFTYTATRDGDLYKVNGTVHVNMKDHDIAEPGYLGVKVKPDVDVSVSFVVKDG